MENRKIGDYVKLPTQCGMCDEGIESRCRGMYVVIRAWETD